MKGHYLSHVMLLTLLALVLVPNSFAQVASPEYVVRVIYFLPSDRTPQPDINAKLDRLIKDTQLFYAGHMEAHGFGKKTFRFEADTAGRVVVHRINGQFNDAYYHSNAWSKVWQEIEGRFDLSNNIYLAALDTSIKTIDNAWCGQGTGSSLAGRALIPASGACFNVIITGHELGHAFGLAHDNRTTGKWIPSVYSSDRMITSFCCAEWLDAHRYFEINQTLSTEMLVPNLTSPFSSAASLEMVQLCGVEALDSHEHFKINETVPGDALPTFEMLGPPSLVAAPNTIRLRFRVTDADGIHQVQLHTPEWDLFVEGGFIACKRVSGTSATVEFVTTELSPRSESVSLRMIDLHGNFGWSESYPITVTTILPPDTAVSIPDPRLAAAIRQKIGNITRHSLLNLRALNAEKYTGIADLTGLENAYNLKYLQEVRHGEITDIRPLANLTGLTDLDLREHQISDISPLGNLTNLSQLLIWTNQISDITALGNLTNLTRLLIDSNQISDITVLQNLTNLRWLGLNSNQISDITMLQNLTNLRGLWLFGNQISDITALSGLTNLTILTLAYNQITDVAPLVGLVNLEELYLVGNPIEDYSPLRTLLANNPNLKIDIEVPPPPPTSITFSPSTVADQTFVVGTAITPFYLPFATGGTAPYTYTLAPLPGGLSFNATERELNGTPTTAETTTTTYTATDAANGSASLTFTIEVTADVILDVNGDGQVTVIDLAIVALFYGTQVPDGVDLPADVNDDGTVDILDLTAVAQAIEVSAGNNSALSADDVAAVLEAIADIEAIPEAPARFSRGNRVTQPLRAGVAYRNVAAAFEAAKHLATEDARLGKWMPLLKELLHLLTEMREIPNTTALLPNYPNPFNPETWIPYQLAKSAEVTLTIYAVDGQVVRTLSLGHHPAGVYQSRSRAAYWDARNAVGEPVASGLYFYTLTAGDFTATRKMLIRK